MGAQLPRAPRTKKHLLPVHYLFKFLSSQQLLVAVQNRMNNSTNSYSVRKMTWEKKCTNIAVAYLDTTSTMDPKKELEKLKREQVDAPWMIVEMTSSCCVQGQAAAAAGGGRQISARFIFQCFVKPPRRARARWARRDWNCDSGAFLL